MRYDYGDHRDPQAATAWLWKFIDGAKTAGELYGRTLVVIAAEQYATRLVVPASQRMPATRWSSHKDIAAKALRKLAGPHAPTSLTKLEQAVKRAHAAYDKADRAARERQHAEADRHAQADTLPVVVKPGCAFHHSLTFHGSAPTSRPWSGARSCRTSCRWRPASTRRTPTSSTPATAAAATSPSMSPSFRCSGTRTAADPPG